MPLDLLPDSSTQHDINSTSDAGASSHCGSTLQIYFLRSVYVCIVGEDLFRRCASDHRFWRSAASFGQSSLQRDPARMSASPEREGALLPSVSAHSGCQGTHCRANLLKTCSAAMPVGRVEAAAKQVRSAYSAAAKNLWDFWPVAMPMANDQWYHQLVNQAPRQHRQS